MIDSAMSRQAQEVYAAMTVAKRFPRDLDESFARIMKACSPSIRLAEVLAQSWGNVDFGIIELEQKPSESIMMAYAWDLETNTRETKVFTVPHIRSKRSGNVRLTDPRDIYELTANMGARRMRACVLGIIPGDIVDAAMDACETTLKHAGGEPISDRLRTVVSVFGELGVTKDMLEKNLGHVLSTTSEQELVNLRKIYTTIKDNFGDVNSFFETGKDEPSAKVQSVKDKLAARRGKQEPPKDPHKHDFAGRGSEIEITPPPEGELEVEETTPEDSGEESPFAKSQEGRYEAEDPVVQKPLPTIQEEADKDQEEFMKLSDVKFTTGPHEGKTVAEVAATKISYIKWMAKRSNDPKLRAACSAMLEVPESPPELIQRIRAIAAKVPMKPEDLDKFVADGYNGKKLDDLTTEELEAVDRFMKDTAGI
jgi:hypothetical protein